MTSNRIFVAIIAVLVVLGFSVAVAAQNGHELGIGKTRTISFGESFQVQGQTLPAGNYTVQHVMEGQNHIMIFRHSPGKEEFRLTCHMVQLPAKAKEGSTAYDTTSGVRVLKSIIFAGDTYEHQFGE